MDYSELIGETFRTRDHVKVKLLRLEKCELARISGRCTFCSGFLLHFDGLENRHCGQDHNNIPFFILEKKTNVRW